MAENGDAYDDSSSHQDRELNTSESGDVTSVVVYERMVSVLSKKELSEQAPEKNLVVSLTLSTILACSSY
jgi:hypothetical protein